MKPVSKADFARLAGVSASTISRAVKSELRAARAADRIDADHPAARLFLAKHRAKKVRR